MTVEPEGLVSAVPVWVWLATLLAFAAIVVLDLAVIAGAGTP